MGCPLAVCFSGGGAGRGSAYKPLVLFRRMHQIITGPRVRVAAPLVLFRRGFASGVSDLRASLTKRDLVYRTSVSSGRTQTRTRLPTRRTLTHHPHHPSQANNVRVAGIRSNTETPLPSLPPCPQSARTHLRQLALGSCSDTLKSAWKRWNWGTHAFHRPRSISPQDHARISIISPPGAETTRLWGSHMAATMLYTSFLQGTRRNPPQASRAFP